MPTLEGIPVSPGYAAGTAIVYAYEIECRLKVPHHSVTRSEIGTECARLDDAVEQSNRELKRAEQSARSEPGRADSADLLTAHSLLVDDVAAKVKQRMGRDLVNVEQVLDDVINEIVERLCQLDNAYLRERQQDIRDVGHRILRHLTGAPPWSHEPLPADSVIVARELLPSETIELAQSGLAAIVAEEGGKYCHTAILARSLRIPAVTGIPTVTSQIQPGMRLLVDGEAGRVTIDPSPSEMERFSKLKRDYERSAVAIAADEMLPCITQDGIEISLLANIGRPEEVEQVGVHNLSGVGLFRTEFLFLESRERPSFQVQLEIYEQAAGALADRPLVIRTFDLGGDKWPAFLSSEQAGPHPSRHLRGLRFSLAEGRLFETQLRAIVQVAQGKDVRLLFPMVVGSHDFSRAAAAVDGVVHELGVAQEAAHRSDDRNACGPVRLGGDPRGRRFRGDRYQRSDRVHASDRSGCGRFDRRVHSHAPRGAEGDQASHRGRRGQTSPGLCLRRGSRRRGLRLLAGWPGDPRIEYESRPSCRGAPEAAEHQLSKCATPSQRSPSLQGS